jgi:hypothetical protein
VQDTAFDFLIEGVFIMAGKVAYISINDVVNAYTSEEIAALETNPPEEILAERASIEERQRQYADLRGEIISGMSPSSKALCNSWLASRNETDGTQLVLEQLPIEEMRWYLETLRQYFMRSAGVTSRESYFCHQMCSAIENLFGDIQQDEQDINAIRERLSKKINAQAQSKVRAALVQLCAEESYDMIFDAAALVAIGIEADNVGPKVLAKINQG